MPVIRDPDEELPDDRGDHAPAEVPDDERDPFDETPETQEDYFPEDDEPPEDEDDEDDPIGDEQCHELP